MTIGVGLLCCSSEQLVTGKRPDTIVMMADTMGSTDEDSTDELRKLFIVSEVKVYAVGAGKLETAGEIVAAFVQRLPGLQNRSHATIRALLNQVVNGHRSERFQMDVVAPRYQITPGKIFPETLPDVLKEFQTYQVGAELIIGTFDDNGMAHMFYLGWMGDSSALVHPVLFPGYQTVGTGHYNATMWLNYRGQRLNFNIKRSALHAYEAAKMAAATPTVNENIDVVIATAIEEYTLPHDLPPSPNAPVTLRDLEKMAKRFGPRKTDSIGFSQPFSN